MAFAQSPEELAEPSKYDSDLLQQYDQECVQTSMAEGLDSTTAKKLCDCTINKFQENYTQAEFVKLTASSATDQQAENALIEIGQTCFEQTLYE